MKSKLKQLGILAMTLAAVAGSAGAAEKLRIVTLDPGHFHAALVQKFMYPQVDPLVHVYAPADTADLQQHLARIEAFNTRAENPTRWQTKVYTGPDFFEKMISEKPGNMVVLSGNNARKTEYIERSIRGGFHVLGDKPMAINPKDFKLLVKAFDEAKKRNLLLYDIMTERFEITSMVQRELQNDSALFGELVKGTPEQPAMVIESVHHFFKEVSGKPLIRPAWFFDVKQQGEALPDVATHLVDLVQWQCFPDQPLNYKKDVKVLAARRWPTSLTKQQFKQVTGLDSYPDYLKKDVDAQGVLNVYENGETTWRLRDNVMKVTALWKFEAAPGAKDNHYALVRGTKADLEIKQGPEQGWKPVLYILNKGAAGFENRVRQAVQKAAAKYPGLEIKPAGDRWELVVPEKYSVGHEAHFGQVMENFLKYIQQGKLPDWEVPNMLTKYYTTTEAYRISLKSK